ncbi:MAG: hypothetical protein ACLSVD_08830 [Eggerthellaceae bacterium]
MVRATEEDPGNFIPYAGRCRQRGRSDARSPPAVSSAFALKGASNDPTRIARLSADLPRHQILILLGRHPHRHVRHLRDLVASSTDSSRRRRNSHTRDLV